MSNKRLGRGLDALLSKPRVSSSATPAEAGGENQSAPVGAIASTDVAREVPVDQIHRSPYQPRRTFEQEALAELSDSIRTQGLLQPILVRERASGGFELIAGERRWRAAQLAQVQSLPAVVRNVTDEQASAMALIENIQREDLKPLEEAQALVRLREEFSLTHEEVAHAVGKSRASVTNLMRLLNLAPRARSLLESGQLEAGHARALLTLTEAQQEAAAQEVVRKRLSVRQTEQLVRRLQAQRAGSTASSGRGKDADTKALERELAERIGAPVSIDHSAQGKGTLTIKYGSLDELEGVLKHLR